MDHQSLMAAMLHDVIEDTGIAQDALQEQFGEAVAELVDGVGKLTHIGFQARPKRAENFQKMTLAMARDLGVIIVAADRLHNMRTIGSLNPGKRRRIAKRPWTYATHRESARNVRAAKRTPDSPTVRCIPCVSSASNVPSRMWQVTVKRSCQKSWNRSRALSARVESRPALRAAKRRPTVSTVK